MFGHPAKPGGRRPTPLLLWILLLALPLCSRAWAEEPEALPEERAGRQVLEAFSAKDTKALARIALDPDSDAWLITDWLLLQGEADAAAAFADAAPGFDYARLADYVAARRGSEDSPEARAALLKARKTIEAGRYADALPILEAIETDEDSVVSAQVHYARGMASYVVQRYGAALEELAAARGMARRIGWAGLESPVLRWLAQTALLAKATAKAVAHAEASVALEKKRGKEDKLAEARFALAGILRKTGALDRALQVLEEAITTNRKREDEAALAKSLMLAAGLADDTGDILTALEHGREALGILERLGDVPRIADALVSVGIFYEEICDYSRSLSFLKRAVRYTQEKELHSLHAHATFHLGFTHASLGDYPRALECYEEALAFRRAHGEVTRTAGVLNNLAVLYEELGDRDRARKMLRETLALFESVEEARGIATACLNLGALELLSGRLKEAALLIDRALELRRLSGDRRGLASAYEALGSVATSAGDHELAARHYRRAVKGYRAVLARGEMAVAMMILGQALERTGKRDEALALLDAASEEARTIHSPRIQVLTLGALARAHFDMGAYDRALLIADKALSQLEHLLGGLGEVEGSAARSKHSSVFEIGALAAFRLRDPAKTLHFLEAGRAGSLLESLGGRDALRWADLPEELRTAEAEARLAEAHAASRYRAAAGAPELEVRRRAERALTDATERVRDVTTKIQRTAKAQAGLFYPRPATARQIQRHLRPGQVLVVYGFCAGQAMAVVLEHKQMRLASLGPTATIRTACEALGRPQADVDAGAEIATLREALVKPLALKAHTKELLISPSGPLCYVPFSALFTQTVTLTPSGTTHGLLSEERRRPGIGVLAVGDPSYGRQPSGAMRVYSRGPQLTPLPGTRVEVERVGDDVLVGARATEGGVRAGIAKRPRWRAVHFACHGRVDRERPTLCALALTPDEEDDGFLTALDVLRMKIPADLAVLSACETGRGRVEKGEGIVGLVRSFMYAGAPRVIASLWKVDDAATQALMVKFYELWSPEKGEGLPAAEALKKAQEYVRTHPKHPEWKQPYYWAAWVLWGLP